MASLSIDERATLFGNPWMAILAEAVRDELAACSRRLVIAKDERFAEQDDDSDAMFFVLSGAVRASRCSADGRESVLDIYPPGAWFGEVGVFCGEPRVNRMSGYVGSVVLSLATEDVEDLMMGHPTLARAFLRMESHRLRILVSALGAFGEQSLEQRLAGRLLSLANGFGKKTKDGVLIDLPLPLETLGRLSAATRQRVGQILNRWDASQILKHRYGHVTLIDVDRLQSLGGLVMTAHR